MKRAYSEILAEKAATHEELATKIETRVNDGDGWYLIDFVACPDGSYTVLYGHSTEREMPA